MILCGLAVVSLLKENVVCRELVDEFLAWSLTPFLAITVMLYSTSGFRFDIITSGAALTTLAGKKRAPKQLFEQTLVLGHALQCKLYSKSTRPPSNAGRDHATITISSDRKDMLMSRGADGGAERNEEVS